MMNVDEWHKLADERSAEIVRLDSVNAALLEALEALSGRVMDCSGDCPHSVVNLAKDSQAAIAKAKAEQS